MNVAGLSERASRLLKHLVESYIRDGQPVGSKKLASEVSDALSPATVRKVLGDLEERGFIASPHTSAGRVPTTQGMRFFVDSLLSVYSVDPLQAQKMEASLDPSLDPNVDPNMDSVDNLISKTSHVLSELTQMVGIVTLPPREYLVLRHVEFLGLSDNRVLVIFVFNEKEVQNRIIFTDYQYTPSELAQASQFFNQHFTGQGLQDCRHELLRTLQADHQHLNNLMTRVFAVASKAFLPDADQAKQAKYVLAGEQNLFFTPGASIGQLQKLFEAFTQKQQVLDLLDHCLCSEGVQIFIGEEAGSEAFREHSVITTRYTVEGQVVGVLGVIGPTRMRYDQVIPVVECTAQVLTSLLNSEK